MTAEEFPDVESKHVDLSAVPLAELAGVVSELRDAPQHVAALGGAEGVLPLQEFVVKVYERCNLACDYCYMYEMADQTWKGRPVKMTTAIFETLTRRIADHAFEHDLEQVHVVFHGGEPLLRGAPFFAYAADRLREELGSINVLMRVQTNATLIDDEMLSVFAEKGIRVGVSLDGDRQANNRHRLRRGGASSFDEVLEGIALLKKPEYRHLFGSIFCTIDIANDPIETYEFLRGVDVPLIDFLLPHGNWETRPPGRPLGFKGTAYADWLIPIFDRWYERPNQKLRIRLFDDIVALLLGGDSQSEHVGLNPVQFVCIDTDGSIEQADALKSTYENAANTGFNILDNSFDEVIDHVGIRARQSGKKGLSEVCQQCDVVDVCGGGNYPHRYRPGNGFENPSVYCDDLFALVRHVADRVQLTIRDVRETLNKA